MTDSDFFELANRVIDGVETDQEREALDAIVGQSMSRRLEFEQLSTVASILDAVRPVEPPEGLRNRILAALPREAPVGASAPATSIWTQIKAFAAGRPGYALTYALATGLIVGIIGLAAIVGVPGVADQSSTFGTMAPVGGAFAVVDQSDIDANGVKASASLLLREAEFVIEVDIESDERVEVVVSPVSEVATWYGVELGGGAKLTGASLDPDELRFPAEGTSAVRVSGLRADMGSVQCIVTVVRDGRQVGEMMLTESDSYAE